MTATLTTPDSLDAPDPTAPTAPPAVRPVQRFVWQPVEIPALPASSSPRLTGCRIAILGGTEETADAVAGALLRAGARPLWLPPCTLRDDVQPSVAAFTAGWCEPAGGLDGIVDLNLEEPLGRTGPDAWSLPLLQTVELLRACLPDWIVEADAARLFYLAVTRMGGRMGFADDPLPQPLGGLWAGLAKGLPREIPNCNVRVLDVGESDRGRLPDLICRELYRWGDFEVGYSGGRRYTLVAQPASAGPATFGLGPGDVVVMTGGGRGIGFALARALCENHGCRVVVSGRGSLPDPSDPLLRMSEDEHRRDRADRLTEAARLGEIAAARAELSRLARTRELAANLAAARRDGLDIRYVQADITRSDEVGALLDAAGPDIAGVIHDAGIDRPSRLATKRSETVADVVAVKVGGFFSLLAAWGDRPPPRFFCNVGSLTGRWGGMTGQLDYGAANEALSRLGLWAAREGGDRPLSRAASVTTLCWPTWDRLGMITNYEATLQYMSALDVAEGLDLWQRELLAGGSGERTYIGEVGPAMLPAVLRGYRQDSGLPSIDRLASSRFYLGEPLRFTPNLSLVSRSVLRAGHLPAALDFRVDGRPALPASLALEFMISAADWVQPPASPPMLPVAARNVRIAVDELGFDGDDTELCLQKEATGRWQADRWEVHVRLLAVDAARGPREVASADVRLAPAEPRLGRAPERVPAALETLGSVTVPARLAWLGHAFRIATWCRDRADGGWWAEVGGTGTEELVATTPAPRARLPLHALENLVRAAYLTGIRRSPGSAPVEFHAELVEFAGDDGGPGGGWVSGSADARRWTCTAADGAVRLRMYQPGFDALRRS